MFWGILSDPPSTPSVSYERLHLSTIKSDLQSCLLITVMHWGNELVIVERGVIWMHGVSCWL